MSNPAATGDATKEADGSSSNAIAVEAISEKLSEVTGLAEELDQALRSAQQDCSFPSTSSGTTYTVPIVITPAISGRRLLETSSTSTGVSKTQDIFFLLIQHFYCEQHNNNTYTVSNKKIYNNRGNRSMYLKYLY